MLDMRESCAHFIGPLEALDFAQGRATLRFLGAARIIRPGLGWAAGIPGPVFDAKLMQVHAKSQ
jgi:hypothetical protein